MDGFEAFVASVKAFQPLIENFKKTDASKLCEHVEISDRHLRFVLACPDPRSVAFTLEDLKNLGFDTRYLAPGSAKDGSAYLYIYHSGKLMCYVCIDATMQDLVQGIEEFLEVTAG